MAKTRIAYSPANPERTCWGCEKYCPANDLACGNGSIRTPHPCELFGRDWLEWASDREQRSRPDTAAKPAAPSTTDPGDVRRRERR